MPFYILAMDYASIAALALITLRWAVERLGFRFAAFAVYGAAVAALSIWLMSFANTPGYRQAWMLTEKVREGLLFVAVLEALFLLVRDFQKVWLRWALVASAGAIFAAAIITALRASPALGQARVIASGNAAVSIWLGCSVIFFLLIFRDGGLRRSVQIHSLSLALMVGGTALADQLYASRTFSAVTCSVIRISAALFPAIWWAIGMTKAMDAPLVRKRMTDEEHAEALRVVGQLEGALRAKAAGR